MRRIKLRKKQKLPLPVQHLLAYLRYFHYSVVTNPTHIILRAGRLKLSFTPSTGMWAYMQPIDSGTRYSTEDHLVRAKVGMFLDRQKVGRRSFRGRALTTYNSEGRHEQKRG